MDKKEIALAIHMDKKEIARAIHNYIHFHLYHILFFLLLPFAPLCLRASLRCGPPGAVLRSRLSVAVLAYARPSLCRRSKVPSV